MVTPTVPGTPRTVSNHGTTPIGSNDDPAPPAEKSDSNRIVISTPTEITTPIRPPPGFPPQVQKNVASSSTTSTPSAHRGVKLDQVVERQANGTTNGTTPALSAKALGKRKRTAEEEEIIYRAGLVFKDNTEKDTTYFTDTYIPVHPFESGFDVVDRLLPFHLWQIHDQDLDFRTKDKKRQENETAGVEKLVTRYTTLMERLRKAQVRADDSESRPDGIQLAQAMTAALRETTDQLRAQLKEVRGENDRIASEIKKRDDEAKKAAAAAAGVPHVSRPGPGRPPGSGTSQVNRAPSTNGGAPSTPGTNKNGPAPMPAPTQPIVLQVSIGVASDLVRLKIINLSVEGKPFDNSAPAKIIRTTEDGKFILLSVLPSALDSGQVQFLADAVNRDRQNRHPEAASPATPSAPVKPAPSPKPVDTS